MDKNLENKLNQILEKVDKIDDLSLRVEAIDKKVNQIDRLAEKLDQVDKKLEGYIEFSSERFVKIEDKLNSAEENMATKKDIQNLKLDLMDKYTDKETVNEHEIRITKLEEKLV